MRRLSPQQLELVSSLADRLGAIRGVEAVVLGGSHARGRVRPASDIDLDLLYSEAAPFSLQSVRELAGEANDTDGPVVSGFADAYGTAACLTRAVNQLVLTLFALNRQHPLNDKTALAEVTDGRAISSALHALEVKGDVTIETIH